MYLISFVSPNSSDLHCKQSSLEEIPFRKYFNISTVPYKFLLCYATDQIIKDHLPPQIAHRCEISPTAPKTSQRYAGFRNECNATKCKKDVKMSNALATMRNSVYAEPKPNPTKMTITDAELRLFVPNLHTLYVYVHIFAQFLLCFLYRIIFEV